MLSGLFHHTKVLSWPERFKWALQMLRTGEDGRANQDIENAAHLICKWEHTHWYGHYHYFAWDDPKKPKHPIPIKPCKMAYDTAIKISNGDLP